MTKRWCAGRKGALTRSRRPDEDPADVAPSTSMLSAGGAEARAKTVAPLILAGVVSGCVREAAVVRVEAKASLRSSNLAASLPGCPADLPAAPTRTER
jgi:hypothetical protein